MSSKSFSKFCLKVCICIAGFGLATSFTPILNPPVKAGLGSDPDCPDIGNSSSMSEDCTGTPTVMEIPFYELGFCTSDPLANYSFSRDNCSKAWSSTTSETIDLATYNYSGLRSGLTEKIPNQTYTHAYVIVGNTWGLKGKAYFNSKTYYSDSSGDFTETEANYSKYNYTIDGMTGTESPDNCYDYANSTDYGPVKAIITDSNLTTASDSSSCNSAERLIGSIDLDTDVVMTDSVKSYNLTWVIRKMGMYVDWEGGTDPSDINAGPFVPVFELAN